jgi:hypothetical protein
MGRSRSYNRGLGLNEIILDKIRRVNDKFAPDLIGQDELAVLTDAVLDYKIGKPVKRGHFSRYDAGVSAGADIAKLSDVKSSAGQQLIIASVGTAVKIYDPSANSWSDWITGLTSGQKFRIVPFADWYILVFDTDDDPKYSLNNFSDWGNLELATASPSQIAAIQSFHDNGGNLTQNTQYKWVIVGLTEDGQLSPPSRPFTHFYDTNRILTTDNDMASTRICFTELPYIGDSRITSRMIFRTKGSNDVPGVSGYKTGEVYYLATILDNDAGGTEYQSEWEDDIADDGLGTEIAIYLNMPTRAKHITYSNERLFFGDFSQKSLNFISPPSSYVDGTPTTPSIGTGGTYAAGDAGYEIADIEDNTTLTGTLQDSTQYDYRIHYIDKYGRLSKYYHQVGAATSAGTGIDDHVLIIRGIGILDNEILKEYPSLKVYRRTGGAGSYYLIATLDLSNGNHKSGTVTFTNGTFVDTGLANGVETWVDPSADINSYPSAICFSEISSPSTIRDEDKRQIFQDDNDEITGLFDDRDGVIIFKRNSINKLFLSGNPINWRLVQLCKDYGCDQPETIQKSGSSFYFIYKNKAYRYDIGADRPIDIGALFQGTLDIMTTFYDSTINDRWYCIQGLLVSSPYTLVYDIKMDTWYKFKRTQSGSEDFKTIYFTKYGSSQQLLSNADAYISLYNDITDYSVITRADSEIGSTQQISPVIRTKAFKFPDGVSLARLRKLKLDYTKVDDQNTTITVRDNDTSETIVLTDSTNSTNSNDSKLYESGIGRDSDTLKTTRSFDVTIQGAGLERFDNLRVEYRPIKRGKAVSA